MSVTNESPFSASLFPTDSRLNANKAAPATTTEKVKNYAKRAVFGLICVGLFFYNPPIFFTAMMVGILVPEAVKRALNNLDLIPKWSLVATVIVGFVVCFFALPATLVILTGLSGAACGSLLSDIAKEKIDIVENQKKSALEKEPKEDLKTRLLNQLQAAQKELTEVAETLKKQ